MPLVDIYVPAQGRGDELSPGLVNDARIIQAVLGKENAKLFPVPARCYREGKARNDQILRSMKTSSTAIFLEHVFESSEIMSYDRRVYVANPEWLIPADEARVRAGYVTEFWHKTRSGVHLLSAMFPGQAHSYVGFTSLDNFGDQPAPNYSKMGHFTGKALGRRHTQELLDIWSENPSLPQLSVHFHNTQIPDITDWLENKNIRVKLGMMEEKHFSKEFAGHGVQLCTSSTEGFGHHINEARAIGALVVTLDAPPMNELVDATSGVLVKFSERLPHHCGFFYKSSKEQLLEAIGRVVAMSSEERVQLGESARRRFLEERDAFSAALRAQFNL